MSQYLAFLKNFRVRAAKPQWTEEQKNACLLFQQYRGTVREGEVRKRIDKESYGLTTQQIGRTRKLGLQLASFANPKLPYFHMLFFVCSLHISYI